MARRALLVATDKVCEALPGRLHPISQRQVWHTLEVRRVIGYQSQAVGERGGGNEQIKIFQQLALDAQLRFQISKQPRRFKRKIDYLQAAYKIIQGLVIGRRMLRTGCSITQFGHGEYRNADRLYAGRG